MEQFKSFALFTLGAIAAWINPIILNVVALLIIFFVNFLFSWIAAMSENESWNFKKAWDSITQACVFFTLVTVMFSLGKLQGNEEGVLQWVSLLIYVVIYFYSVNVLKNIIIIFPAKSVGYRIVNFLHHAITIEFIKQLPILGTFLKKEYDYKRNDSGTAQ